MDQIGSFEVTLHNATNWDASIDLNPGKIVYANTVEDIIEVLKDIDQYPSPVRALGSRHSTTHCGVTDHGTLVIMRRMDRIIDIDTENMTVTVQAGALYIDVAKALAKVGLQFFINVEIGNLTIGSAAVAGTKDASMPGEMGQICSYATLIKMVMPNGELLEVSDAQTELMQAVRSSYGLMGVIYEVTFRIKSLCAVSVYHKSYTLDKFERTLPELKTQGHSMMYYLFPFANLITVEFRHEADGQQPNSRWLWYLRNMIWKTIAPLFSHVATRFIGNKKIRYFLIDNFIITILYRMAFLLKSNRTNPSDQIIRYSEKVKPVKLLLAFGRLPKRPS